MIPVPDGADTPVFLIEGVATSDILGEIQHDAMRAAFEGTSWRILGLHRASLLANVASRCLLAKASFRCRGWRPERGTKVEDGTDSDDKSDADW